ncbi:MAG: malic enzyme-like NAD(P)-binding protein [Acidithiobacillus sp.]
MGESDRQDDLRRRALAYHALPQPGKLRVEPSKPCATQEDLSLAYTPGVAEPVRAIVADPDCAYDYTGKGNLVAVISNGTAVLGLGNVGPLAGKPVMEGKALLFKRFADIDAFDIEVDARDAEHLIDVVMAIAPGFGGINLEDIAAPDCFRVESVLQERLDIPVFHDDQHGTAVIVGAALQNALEIQGKALAGAKVAIVGAGAAGLAIARMLRRLGAEEVLLSDKDGVLHRDRRDLSPWHTPFAIAPAGMVLAEMLAGADVVIGVSVRGAIPAEALPGLANNPVIFALANPDPEIDPALVRRLRPDAIIATGRSDLPNQVNNVLGFPFLFRGALDCRARQINEAMLLAAVDGLARLAREPVPDAVLAAYGMQECRFGPQYIIPKPLDLRLRHWVADAVAAAGRASGVARR